MAARVMGLRVVDSKSTGKVSTIVYYSTEFSDYEAESANSVSGLKVGNEYIRGEVAVSVGDEVVFTYERGFQDKAVFSGLTVVKSWKDFKEK